MLWICEKREGVILARMLLPGAVLQDLWYKIMCFGELKEQRKGKKTKKPKPKPTACFNKSVLLLLDLSLHSPLPVAFEGCRVQPMI